jgi:hypothetical protein
MSFEQPSGVVAIFQTESGSQIATVADFDPAGGDSGFSLLEHQRRRAKQSLARAVAEAYCAPDYVRVMSQYELDLFMQRLRDRHKCVVSIIEVNHE